MLLLCLFFFFFSKCSSGPAAWLVFKELGYLGHNTWKCRLGEQERYVISLITYINVLGLSGKVLVVGELQERLL